MTDHTASDRDAGFAGMLARGLTPDEAYAAVVADARSSSASLIIGRLRMDSAGQAALRCAADRWAELGYKPPWDPDPGPLPQMQLQPGDALTTADRPGQPYTVTASQACQQGDHAGFGHLAYEVRLSPGHRIWVCAYEVRPYDGPQQL